MKKAFALSCFLIGFLFLCAARAETFVIPKEIEALETEAFANLGAYDAVLIPSGVQSIARDAFGDQSFRVLGLPDTEAERFAQETRRAFESIDISNITLSCGDWAAPGLPIPVSANASSVIWPLSYRFVVEKDGVPYYDSGLPGESCAEVFVPEGGIYDVRVIVSHDWAEREALFPGAIDVDDGVLFSQNPLRVNVGETVSLLSEMETRSVRLFTDNPSMLRLSGAFGTGLKPGFCRLTGVIEQEKGNIETVADVEICVPVTDILFENPPEKLFLLKPVSLSASVFPASASHPEITWTSSDEHIAVVDENGVVTAYNRGTVEIIATADGVSRALPLTAVIPVSEIQISRKDEDAPFYTGTALALNASVSPQYADDSTVLWRSSDERIASVNNNGEVTALKAGEVSVFCEAADGGGAFAEYPLTVLQGPSEIDLSSSKSYLLPGESICLTAKILPESASATPLVWSSSDETALSVDENGVVTHVGEGVATITVTGVNGVRAGITLRAYAIRVPAAFIMKESSVYMNIGETYALSFTCEPEGAVDECVWLSSNTSVATVDENGAVKAVGSGAVTVSVYSSVDASVSAVCSVTVLNPSRTLVMPARRTSVSGISANLQKISAVKSSAYNELEALRAAGKISSSVMNKRKNAVSSAFAMYSFPWMTLNVQEYWKAENSENGAKDFQPGTVYYGLPYISGSYYYQRLYNVLKALNENRYYLSDSGNYYILNQNRLYSGKYCGNDCSSMVALAYFGSGAAGIGDWNTHKFYTSKDFTTLSKSAELYPGDIIVRDYRHVVMFLYYANAAKTQFVVIEQGGTEAAINTVSASVYDAAHFFSNSYIPRRYDGWM